MPMFRVGIPDVEYDRSVNQSENISLCVNSRV